MLYTCSFISTLYSILCSAGQFSPISLYIKPPISSLCLKAFTSTETCIYCYLMIKKVSITPARYFEVLELWNWGMLAIKKKSSPCVSQMEKLLKTTGESFNQTMPSEKVQVMAYWIYVIERKRDDCKNKQNNRFLTNNKKGVPRNTK